jgi:hypothetical protein
VEEAPYTPSTGKLRKKQYLSAKQFKVTLSKFCTELWMPDFVGPSIFTKKKN